MESRHVFVYARKGGEGKHTDEYGVQLIDEEPDRSTDWIIDLPNTHAMTVTIHIYSDEPKPSAVVMGIIENRAKGLVSRKLFGPK